MFFNHKDNNKNNEDMDQSIYIKNDPIAKSLIDDPHLGLVPYCPIFVHGMQNALKYLNALRLPNGQNLEYERVSPSQEVKGISGSIDCYHLYYFHRSFIFNKKVHVGYVFICEYCSFTMDRAPEGLLLELSVLNG